MDVSWCFDVQPVEEIGAEGDLGWDDFMVHER